VNSNFSRVYGTLLTIVSSDHPQVPAVDIKQILETNIASHRPRKMRIVCRVRDYYPRDLADFAVAWCNLCKNTYLPESLASDLSLLFRKICYFMVDFDLFSLKSSFPCFYFLVFPVDLLSLWI
jgi:hypothetical protein